MKYKRTHEITSILILVIFCLFLSGCVETENAIDPVSLKNWEIYNTENGLGSDSVRTLFEDKEGNIWVGTWNKGVCKFDGKMWTTYNVSSGLIDNSVLSIAQDGYDRMWFGTDGGLSIFSDNKWTNINDYGSISSILKDFDDNMWWSTSNYAVLEFTNDKIFQYYDTLCLWCNTVNVLFEDRERNIWFGSERDLKKITGQTMTSFTQSDGLPVGIMGIISMDQDIWGNIWIGTDMTGSVARYNNGKFELVSLMTGSSINSVMSIASDNNGNVWFGLWGQQIMKYNGSVMKPYTVEDGLPGINVTKILKDKKGYLWFGTRGGGVAKYLPVLE
jgi:ligand-binding sensor domain-containing protein